MAFLNVSSWGRLSRTSHDVRYLFDGKEILNADCKGIAYGMGRSYGDVCLNPGQVLWETKCLDKFIHFDDKTGQLTCESGVLLGDIQRLMMKRGWALPVTPGTEYVTVGGAIANDVHGKNHHRLGSFGHHILRMTLMRTDGTRIDCAPDVLPDWFAATVGGLGLTGLILNATLQLRPVKGSWLATETIPFSHLSEFFHLADASEGKWEYTVAWIDCFAKRHTRGIFMRANLSEVTSQKEPKNRERSFPSLPFSLIHPFSVKLFNEAYFYMQKRQKGEKLMHYIPFFYPLDHIKNWNRMYGKQGLYQHQSVMERPDGEEGVDRLLHEVARSKVGSFLAVLKTFGHIDSCGLLSFPKPGVTLALDFPNQGERTRQLLDKLNGVVMEAKGRIYPAKDAHMSMELFKAGYPRWSEFEAFRDRGMSSSLSRRLLGS